MTKRQFLAFYLPRGNFGSERALAYSWRNYSLLIRNFSTSSPLNKPRCHTGWPGIVIVRIPGGYPLKDPIGIFIVLLCKLEEPCLSERVLVRVIVVELINQFLAKFTSIVFSISSHFGMLSSGQVHFNWMDQTFAYRKKHQCLYCLCLYCISKQQNTNSSNVQ